MEYRCIKEFWLGKVDEDGFPIPNEVGVVTVGSVWYTDDTSIIGGELHLECKSGTNDFGWIEISKEKLAECFEDINKH